MLCVQDNDERVLIETLLRLFDIPHAELNPDNGPESRRKQQASILAGADRWVGIMPLTHLVLHSMEFSFVFQHDKVPA